MHLRASPATHLLVTDAGYIMLPSSLVTPSRRRKRSTGFNVKATAEGAEAKLSHPPTVGKCGGRGLAKGHKYTRQ